MYVSVKRGDYVHPKEIAVKEKKANLSVSLSYVKSRNMGSGHLRGEHSNIGTSNTMTIPPLGQSLMQGLE